MTWMMVAVLLFCDRDVAPIFGHLSTARRRAEVRRAAVFGAVALMALVLPAAAFGHATLSHTTPAVPVTD